MQDITTQELYKLLTAIHGKFGAILEPWFDPLGNFQYSLWFIQCIGEMTREGCTVEQIDKWKKEAVETIIKEMGSVQQALEWAHAALAVPVSTYEAQYVQYGNYTRPHSGTHE